MLADRARKQDDALHTGADAPEAAARAPCLFGEEPLGPGRLRDRGIEEEGQGRDLRLGLEVEIAIAAKAMLDKKGIPTRVVSVPSMELFEKQSKAYKAKVLGTEKIRIAVEAGLRMGWDRFIGTEGKFIGMTGFGASGPAEQLYEKFGITAKAVVKAATGK